MVGLMAFPSMKWYARTSRAVTGGVVLGPGGNGDKADECTFDPSSSVARTPP